MIVVAIIAVLVAILIPVFGASRANAIQAKDAANVRGAYAEAVVNAMAKGVYDASGKIEAEMTMPAKDSNTQVGYSGNVITVKTAGATSDPVTITVDADVTLTLASGATWDTIT